MTNFDANLLQKNNQRLIDIIIEISNEDSKLPNKRKLVESLIELYSNRWRHSYSIITQYFLTSYGQKTQLKKLDDILSDLVNKIAILLDYLIDEKEQLNIDDTAFNNCRRNMEKLLDHLNLELIRKRYIEGLYKNVFHQAEKANKNVQTIEKCINEFDIKVKSNTEESKRLKSESITILGIFSSIIAVLVAGIGLSSAIFANMQEVSSWLLSALSVLIVPFISNILFQLFNFLREIADKPLKKSPTLACFNLGLSLLACFCLYMHYFYF